MSSKNHTTRLQFNTTIQPSFNPCQKLSIARCYKSFGYRHIVSGFAYCTQCYHIYQPRYQDQYEWIVSHHLISGEHFREIICARCNTDITIVKPIYQCDQCLLRFLEYILYCDERQINTLPNPLILHVNGARYY